MSNLAYCAFGVVVGGILDGLHWRMMMEDWRYYSIVACAAFVGAVVKAEAQWER